MANWYCAAQDKHEAVDLFELALCDSSLRVARANARRYAKEDGDGTRYYVYHLDGRTGKVQRVPPKEET